MIPRKLALRIWSACLRGQADVLTGRVRPAHRVRATAGVKTVGRAELGRRMDAQADAIESWIDSDLCRGGDLPDDLAIQVAAYLFRHGEAVRWVREWFSARDISSPSDPVATIRLIMETV